MLTALEKRLIRDQATKDALFNEVCSYCISCVCDVSLAVCGCRVEEEGEEEEEERRRVE